MTPEGEVVAAVERYFSQPKFQKFFTKQEHPIQMGADNRRADVVLLNNSTGSLASIAECKRDGVEGSGIDQLKSYLSATDTPFGIFANSTEPDSWSFYENLRRNQFREIARPEFEDMVVKEKKGLSQSDGQLVRSRYPKHFGNKGGSMKIRPTLYVGLGTTGVEILNHLRELNFQEYGKAGLSIFRYISIETDEGNNGRMLFDEDRIRGSYDEEGVPQIEGRHSPLPYEVNKVIHTPIPHTEPIRERITNSNSPVFDKHLAEWLDERILDSESVKLAGAGAGNLRMAGRLSLWENWSEGVMPTLSQAYYAFQHPDHKSEAEEFLNRHFDGTIEVDNKKHNIFVVGTLCGGTCSGMLLDIAYYLRHIGNEDTKIYGIFTMYNEGLALGGDPTILLANCYASLVELDYYKRPETTYEVTFPNGSDVKYRDEAPFNITTFLSATNMANWNCATQEGLFDRTQLNQMAATDLFVRSLGIDVLIEADYTNVPKRDYRFGKIRETGNNTRTGAFVQYMFSSGVDVVGVHKNLITMSADREFIHTLRKRWEASQPAPASPKPETLVPSDILGRIKAVLPKTDEDVEPSFNEQLEADIETINGTDPNGTAYRCLHRLVPGGKYENLFEKNSSLYCQQYCEDLKESLGNFKGNLQLFPKRNFLNRVDSLIHAKLADLEEDDHPWDSAPSDAEISKVVDEAKEANTEIISKQGPLRKDRSEFTLSRFKGSMRDEQGRYRLKFIAFFVGKTLRSLQSEIKKLQAEVQREIDAINGKFTTAESFLSESDSSQKEVAVAFSKHVHDNKFMTPESVEELISLVCRVEPDAFQWYVQDKLRQYFNDFVPNLIRYPQSDFDRDAPTRSAPYQEFTPYYENYRLSFEQQGGMTRLFRYLFAKDDDSDLRFKTQTEFKEDFAVSNLRVLYQMEAGYALDDIRVVTQLKQAYDAAQDRCRKGIDDPIHIHKNPDQFDQEAIEKLTRFNQRIEEISKKDWRALRELIPRIREGGANRFQNVLSEGTLDQNGNLNGDRTLPVGELEVKVVGDAGFPETFSDTKQGWEKLASASKDSQMSLACNNFRNQIRREFRSMFGSHKDPSSLQYHIADLLRTKTGADLEEGEQFYKEYIDLVEDYLEPDQD